jgi:hypothetical protein
VNPKDREKALRRYVLGTSPDDEQSALDEALARDPEGSFDELAAAEADLLDAYAAGSLSRALRSQVEEAYGSTAAGRRRLAFAAALQRRAAALPAARRPAPAWLPLAAALATVAVGAGLLGWRDHGLRRELGRLELAQQQAARQTERLALEAETGKAEVARLRAQLETALRESAATELPRAVVSIARLALRPGLMREAGSARELELAPGIEQVELELELPDALAGAHAAYRVSLETPESGSLWRSERLVAATRGGRALLAARVPAEVLGDGTYVVSVFGSTASGAEEPVADYSFRARRRH